MVETKILMRSHQAWMVALVQDKKLDHFDQIKKNFMVQLIIRTSNAT